MDDEFEVEGWDSSETAWLLAIGAIVAIWSVIFVLAVCVVTR